MRLDQIHEQNNKIIKGAGGASDLLNKEDDSALLQWEVCSPELARVVILEFEDCLDWNDIPAESSNKHHEDNESFNQRFSSDVSRLVKCITVNTFTQNHLTKLNNLKVIVPETARSVIENLEKCRKEQLTAFISGRLVLRNVPISHTITTNKIDTWNCTNRVEKVEFSLSISVLKKMNSACEYRKDLAKKLFEQEINNIPQSLCVDGKNGIELSHGSKSEITKRFHSPKSIVLPYKSSIVIEMLPLIKAKASATHTGSLANFREFSLLVYYKVMKYGTNYDRIDLVFDRYFEKSHKERTRSPRGEGSQYLFEGDSTKIPFKMADSFLKSSENKNELNEYLATKITRTTPR